MKNKKIVDDYVISELLIENQHFYSSEFKNKYHGIFLKRHILFSKRKYKY